MTNNISKNLINILINENSYILKYPYENTILKFTSNYTI